MVLCISKKMLAVKRCLNYQKKEFLKLNKKCWLGSSIFFTLCMHKLFYLRLQFHNILAENFFHECSKFAKIKKTKILRFF